MPAPPRKKKELPPLPPAPIRATGREERAAVSVPQTSQARVRRWLEVVDLHTKGYSFRAIAAHFGWASPAAAHRAYQQGLSMLPSPGIGEVRRGSHLRLEMLLRYQLASVVNPGPLVSQGKVMWRNEDTGDYFPDEGVRTRAIESAVRIDESLRKLHGADAAKRQVSFLAQIPAEEVEAYIAGLKAEREQQSQVVPLPVEAGDLYEGGEPDGEGDGGPGERL